MIDNHKKDYQQLFDRVKLQISNGNTSLSDLPTDELVKKYTSSSKYFVDPVLEILLFNYGRYLLISSSRKGSLPANLQRYMECKKNPSWDSDYHTDIN